MPIMPPSFRPPRSPSRVEQRREQDARRGSSRQRGYDTRWQKASASNLRDHPLCAYCELEGRVTPATLTDHLYPHRVFEGTFWRKDWWVASCKPCHDGMKQAVERLGKTAIDRLARALGRPVHE
jgi:5-methylcytosine-specific restriction protein A